MTQRIEVECPHPECGATLKIRDTLPEGEYLCTCHGCTIKLAWAMYLHSGRKPYVTLVDKEKGA